MQLPDDIYYGMDDFTITRFFRESGVLHRLDQTALRNLMTQTDQNRYRARAVFIKMNCLNDWIAWRSSEMAGFYRKLGAMIEQCRPGSCLYLVGTDMLRGRQSENRIHPDLSGISAFEDAFRMIGFDLADYNSGNENVVFLRPGCLEENGSANEQALAAQLDRFELVQRFAGNSLKSGVSFYHHTKSKKLSDFEKKSPYQPTFTQIMTRSIPSDYENRRRFCQQLAGSETMQYFDGGEMIPFGGEESLQEWISVFRSIPAVPFKDVKPSSISPETKGFGPVKIRSGKIGKDLWFYAVNNAPFHSGIKLSGKYAPGTDLEVRSGGQDVADPSLGNESYSWSFSMRPYDLIAWKISDTKSVLQNAEVSLPSEICDQNGLLAGLVKDYADRLLIACQGIPLELPKNFSSAEKEGSANDKKFPLIDVPKFNLLKSGHGSVKGNSGPVSEQTGDGKDPNRPNASKSSLENFSRWQRFGDQSFETNFDEQNKYSGEASLRLTSCGTPGGIISPVFASPLTGRICLRLSFGVPAGLDNLPLFITLTARNQGKPYIRKLEIGSALIAKRKEAQQAGLSDARSVFWTEEMVLFEKLPVNGLEDLTLRFDLLAEGSVWFDNARLYQLAFTENEQKELVRKIKDSETFISSGNIEGSLAFIDDYWSKILFELIPENSPLLADRPVRPSFLSNNVNKNPKQEEPVKEANDNIFKKLMFWK